MLSKNWFSEINLDSTAFSIKVNKPLAKVKSPFQTIEIFNNQRLGNTMVIDGYLMLTAFDNFFYHEMMAHTSLYSHPNPEKVLIIGGGDCGTLQQVLKHKSVNEVIQVEIDAEVTNLAVKYFPELCTENEDKRATLLFEDGIKWVNDNQDKKFDVIIIDSSEPEGPGKELFTSSFYNKCKNILSSQGVIIHQSGSPIYQPEQSSLVNKEMRSVFPSTQTITFPVPCYPSGYWSATMSSNVKSDFTIKNKNNIKNLKYYNEGIHTATSLNPNFLIENLV